MTNVELREMNIMVVDVSGEVLAGTKEIFLRRLIFRLFSRVGESSLTPSQS